jgi:hypothetical protein
MWKSPWPEIFEEGEADTARHLKLDSAEEIRCNALLQLAHYLQEVCCYHDRNVQRRSFNVGDMVVRRILDDTRLHKLKSWWEGPSIVHKVIGPGSYHLQYPDGQEVPNSWNIEHLCHFHPWSSGNIFCWHLVIDTSSITPFYRFMTGSMCQFTEGASLPYFRYLTTSFRLVSWVTEGVLRSYF